MGSSMAETQLPDFSQFTTVHKNLPTPKLIEMALSRGEGVLTERGALVARTGKYTGRTPKDKFVVRTPEVENDIWWENNQEMTPEQFNALWNKAVEEAKKRELFQVDTYGGADPKYRICARFIVEKAWHAQFIKTLLIRPSREELKSFTPDWTILDISTVELDPAVDNTRGDAVIALNFVEKKVVIMGTQYAGEMKKSVFTILNYLLPLQGVMSMHCSANIGKDGDVALFFGLSGTGKTTLSADEERNLIGDDEHGWSDNGVFNFEGGCYAKCINLSPEGEPQIYNAIRYGSILENIPLDDEVRVPIYDDPVYTENTRCAYPVEFIEGAVIPSVGGHPKNIVFLTADAFGVLPPIAKLTPEQTMEYFLNGYTAKVAGTEAGVTEPQATFSTCFGAPFMPLKPKVYAELLREKIESHGASVWLINTGWTGGPYGVGSRMKLSHTRAMIKAAFSGELDKVEFITDPHFGLAIPTSCPDVPSQVLNPRETWSDTSAYDTEATRVKTMFDENIKKFQ